jgi:hypothetical protein
MSFTSPSSGVFHAAVASVSEHLPRGATLLPDDLWIYPHTIDGRASHRGRIQGPCRESMQPCPAVMYMETAPSQHRLSFPGPRERCCCTALHIEIPGTISGPRLPARYCSLLLLRLALPTGTARRDPTPSRSRGGVGRLIDASCSTQPRPALPHEPPPCLRDIPIRFDLGRRVPAVSGAGSGPRGVPREFGILTATDIRRV